MITSRMHQEKILYMMKWIPFKRNYTKLGKTGTGGDKVICFCLYSQFANRVKRLCGECIALGL